MYIHGSHHGDCEPMCGIQASEFLSGSLGHLMQLNNINGKLF